MITHLTLPVEKLIELTVITKWMNLMPEELNDVVDDRFHESVADRQAEIAETDENGDLLDQHDLVLCYIFTNGEQVLAAVTSETGEPFSAEQLAACETSEDGQELYIPFRAE